MQIEISNKEIINFTIVFTANIIFNIKHHFSLSRLILVSASVVWILRQSHNNNKTNHDRNAFFRINKNVYSYSYLQNDQCFVRQITWKLIKATNEFFISYFPFIKWNVKKILIRVLKKGYSMYFSILLYSTYI